MIRTYRQKSNVRHTKMAKLLCLLFLVALFRTAARVPRNVTIAKSTSGNSAVLPDADWPPNFLCGPECIVACEVKYGDQCCSETVISGGIKCHCCGPIGIKVTCCADGNCCDANQTCYNGLCCPDDPECPRCDLGGGEDAQSCITRSGRLCCLGDNDECCPYGSNYDNSCCNPELAEVCLPPSGNFYGGCCKTQCLGATGLFCCAEWEQCMYRSGIGFCCPASNVCGDDPNNLECCEQGTSCGTCGGLPCCVIQQ